MNGDVYLNHAATSHPKPMEVLRAVLEALIAPPQEPGRGGGKDRSMGCRRVAARLFRLSDPCRVILVPSATFALNVAIHGLLGNHAGGSVLTTAAEHNSVLRPLAHLVAERGLGIHFLPLHGAGEVDLAELDAALSQGPRLVVLAQACNVSGALRPVPEMAAACARAGVPLVLDLSQSAGCVNLDFGTLPGQVYAAVAGHKGLQGPMGTGLLLLPEGDALPPFLVGGTGIHSESRLQPDELPLRLEAGTPNLPGLAGLEAGLEWVLEQAPSALGQRRDLLADDLVRMLRGVPGLTFHPEPPAFNPTGLLSFRLAGWDPGELGFMLLETYRIHTRSGLHCAPLMHRWLGTAPEGTLRLSLGASSTAGDLEAVVRALREAAA